VLSVGAPSDVDTLLSAAAEIGTDASPSVDLGENLYVTERMVVSPCAGVFTPRTDLSPGATLAVGELIGTVGDEEVRSPFGGALMGVLAFEGERVTARQPIAWLRSS